MDLDGTLYAGVLGEDGPDGVILTEGHRVLQSRLAALMHEGVFLALVSRNELADVRELFARRRDFTLALEDFSAVEVSWGDKATALERVAAELRIGLDAVVVRRRQSGRARRRRDAAAGRYRPRAGRWPRNRGGARSRRRAVPLDPLCRRRIARR